jgi:1,4-alpha-glucan branching enzyme
VVAVNFTPEPKTGYRIGVPQPGDYREILNSDSHYYGGGNLGNAGRLEAFPGAWMNQPAYLEITLPPLAAVVLRRG